MSDRFSKRQIDVISNLIADGEPKNFKSRIFEGCLSFDEIENLCAIIGKEFVLKGLNADWEPNEYGIELENILDIVNNPRLISSE